MEPTVTFQSLSTLTAKLPQAIHIWAMRDSDCLNNMNVLDWFYMTEIIHSFLHLFILLPVSSEYCTK